MVLRDLQRPLAGAVTRGLNVGTLSSRGVILIGPHTGCGGGMVAFILVAKSLSVGSMQETRWTSRFELKWSVFTQSP